MKVTGKSSLIFSLLFLTTVALISPAPQYERSIYLALSTGAWAVFCASILSLVTTLAIALYRRNVKYLYVGLLSAFITYFGFFMIPFSRGYFLNTGYQADTLFHLGVVKDILKIGELPLLTYPGTHLFVTKVHLITDIRLSDLPWLISFVFFVFFVLSLVLVAKALSDDRRIVIAVGLAASTLLFAKYRYEMMPWIYAMPFAFLSIAVVKWNITTRLPRMAFLFIIVGVGLVVFHPMTALYGILGIAGYLALQKHNGEQIISWTEVITTSAILGIPLLAWHIIEGAVLGHLLGAFLRLGSGASGPGIKASQSAAGLNYTPLQFLSRFIIQVWGDILYYGIAGGIVVMYVAVLWYKQEATDFEKFVSSQYVIGGLSAVVLLFVGFFGNSIRRAGQYPIILSIFTVGIGLYLIASRIEGRDRFQREQLIIVGIVILLIAPVMIFSAATMYAPDRHVTDKAATGHAWILDAKNMNYPLVARPAEGRYADFHFGYQQTRAHTSTGDIVKNTRAPPDRLGYDKSATILTSLNESSQSYLLTKRGDRQWYLVEPEWRHPHLDYYTIADYRQLSQDHMANRVYSNGGVDIWLIEEAENTGRD